MGSEANPINANCVVTNSISQVNAADMKPYECKPMPSMFTPNHDHAVTTFPKIARLISPRSLAIPPQRA